MKASSLRVVDGGKPSPSPGKPPQPPRRSRQSGQNADLADARKNETSRPQPRLAIGSSADELAAIAERLAKRTRSVNTVSGYAKDWTHFAAWCAANRRESLPAGAETVRHYLAFFGTGARPLKATTLERKMAAIAFRHREAGLETPTRADAVRDVLTGIRRTQAREGIRTEKKMPVRQEDLWKIVRLLAAEATLASVRNRTILLLGWAIAGRRSPIAAVTVADIQQVPEGLLLTIRSDKTDQESKGRSVPIWREDDPSVCPVAAYREWIAVSGIRRGPLFRGIDRHGNLSPRRLSDRSVALIIKAAVTRIGLDPAKYGGHSLRAGYATSAHEAGASDFAIAQITGHADLDVLRGYFRDLKLFDNNPMRPPDRPS